MMSTVAQVMKERVEHPRVDDPGTASHEDRRDENRDAAYWAQLAERRLARLVEAEHDASVSRDRLDMLQAEYRELLALSEGRSLRIHVLERELASVLTSKSWRWSMWLRDFASWSRGIKSRVRRMAKKVVKLPFVRPIVKLSVQLLPGLSARLHAKLHAHKD
jgi:hypothetical protein